MGEVILSWVSLENTLTENGFYLGHEGDQGETVWQFTRQGNGIQIESLGTVLGKL